VQVDPIKRNLKPPGTKRLKRKCDEPPSNFAFKFKLRRYIMAAAKLKAAATIASAGVAGRGLHSSTFQLNLSRIGRTSPVSPCLIDWGTIMHPTYPSHQICVR
jgi:hypothetical protein